MWFRAQMGRKGICLWKGQRTTEVTTKHINILSYIQIVSPTQFQLSQISNVPHYTQRSMMERKSVWQTRAILSNCLYNIFLCQFASTCMGEPWSLSFITFGPNPPLIACLFVSENNKVSYELGLKEDTIFDNIEELWNRLSWKATSQGKVIWLSGSIPSPFQVFVMNLKWDNQPACDFFQTKLSAVAEKAESWLHPRLSSVGWMWQKERGQICRVIFARNYL